MSTEANGLYARKSMLQNEDWWAVWLGLFVFFLGLGPIFGADWLGWLTKQNVWIDISKSIAPISKTYQNISGFTSAVYMYLFMLAVTTVGALFMRVNPARYIAGFSIIFWITFLCMILGNNAYIAATPNARAGFGITWSLGLGEMGLVFAMIV
ncbi:MAG: putative sulfate exporter family transporter, partial [Peptococcaceae bacterium]|nr:putative sulfate exporter family transporter [Peptococcaceae bacterium]